MGIATTLVGLAIFCMAMWEWSSRLPSDQVRPLRRWFYVWMIKGLLAPFLIWMLFNSAIFDALTPILPAVQWAKLNGEWIAELISVATLGLFVIATYWCALTVIWVLIILWQETTEPALFRKCVLFWSAFLAPLAAIIVLSFGWRAAGLGITLWLLPIFQQIIALRPEPKVAPLYSHAIAAIHFDKFEEAEQAVIKELESCEDDFDGWMMLAELYAIHFHDLPAAEKLIREICDHPATTPSQFSVACHRMADWHLKVGQDPVAARAALAEICRHSPRSHLDRMARLRMRQIPETREEWIASHGIRVISLPVLGAVKEDPGPVKMSRDEAFQRSQECVRRLQTNPDDMAARETLARLWAVELGMVQLAVEQMELLINMPGTTPFKAAEWLALMASWHLKFPPNLPAARKVLERLIRLYPQSPQALAARRRLSILEIEDKMRGEKRLTGGGKSI
jgi:hypothetical protein